ncbi:MAG: hypothetical protein IJ958_07935 [Agathobacter sp.]|nr:hypothetical protein [Agathobacter sp.]
MNNINDYKETISILELYFEEMFMRNDLSFVFENDFKPLFQKLLHESLVLEWISEDKKADFDFIINHANEIKKSYLL